MKKLSVSIFGQTIRCRVYTVNRELIRVPEIQCTVFNETFCPNMETENSLSSVYGI